MPAKDRSGGVWFVENKTCPKHGNQKAILRFDGKVALWICWPCFVQHNTTNFPEKS